MNKIVSYSKIGSMFHISKITVKNRIESLLEKGLIYVKKQGKIKAVNITEKGKNILIQ
jgi:predicted transcriptional regulator